MSQIFKDKIPNKIIYDFIEEFGTKGSDYYILSKNSYKKANLSNAVDPFYTSLKPYYYKSKLFYITRKKNYKNFITIIRQLCKHNKIPFSSKIFYSNSNNEIKYFIYIK